MSNIVRLLFDDADSEMSSKSSLKFNGCGENSGDLYEETICSMLSLMLAKDPYNLRVHNSGKYKDPEDIIIRKARSDKSIFIQIKSTEYYSGGGVNKKGNSSHKKINCFTFGFRKSKALFYKQSNVKFIIFCTLFDSNTSYSGIRSARSTPLLYVWIVPIDTVINYWNDKTPGSDYTIDIRDTQFEHNYFQNYDLLVDACNG